VDLTTIPLYTDDVACQTEYAFVPRPGIKTHLNHEEVSALAWVFACDTMEVADGVVATLMSKLKHVKKRKLGKGGAPTEEPREVYYTADYVNGVWLVLICMLEDESDPERGIVEYIDLRAETRPN